MLRDVLEKGSGNSVARRGSVCSSKRSKGAEETLNFVALSHSDTHTLADKDQAEIGRAERERESKCQGL